MHHDLIGSAGGADKLLGAGWTLNEVRIALGENPVQDPDADRRFITRNYAEIEDIAEGGDLNA